MLHLIRRFLQSLSKRVPSVSDASRLREVMTEKEFALWRTMSPADQRHSLKVVDRFVGRLPDATSAEIVGVALHDVGKVASDLGTLGRVMATICGPRTSRFKIYHDHESIGLQMLRDLGSSADVLTMLNGSARPSALHAFRWADDC